MAFTKIFGTTSGDWGTDTLWRQINVRTSAYSWTVSGSGTSEYYLRTAANGNPGFAASPTTVYLNGASVTSGSLGSLTAGHWAYGDNDTLGYSTLYVRTSGSVDPDTLVDGYVAFTQIPKAAENVRFVSDSGSITSSTSLDQSAVALNDFIVEEGYLGTIGSASLGYLLCDPDRFEFNGRGEAWINLTTAAIPAVIRGTASAVQGARGLYLKGTGITVLSVSGGSQVGLAVRGGELSTATTARVIGSSSSLWIGNGVTLTNYHQFDGEGRVRCNRTNEILYGGTLYSEENGTVTTFTQKGGTYVHNSTGTMTTHHAYGGTFDEKQFGGARTITTRNLYGAGSMTILRNKEAVTVTTLTENDSYQMSISG